MLKIERIETVKDKIKQRSLMDLGVIPPFPTISIINASAGSGKTTLMANLLIRPEFYGPSLEGVVPDKPGEKIKPRGYFDAILLLLGSNDDMYDELIKREIIQANHVRLQPTVADLQSIVDSQTKLIAKAKGKLHKVPKILILMDDLINNKKLMASDVFKRLMTQNRHLNASVFFLSQYLNSIPKCSRLQASFLFCFRMNRVEYELLKEQFCPNGVPTKIFEQIVVKATSPDEDNKNNFLLISKKESLNRRFRKNLEEYIPCVEEDDFDDHDKKYAAALKTLSKRHKIVAKHDSDDEKDEIKHVVQNGMDTFTSTPEPDAPESKKIIRPLGVPRKHRNRFA